MAFNGEIPDGMIVCHKCDIRCCVNPDHLFIGTYQDNMDDMMRKGRHKTMEGEYHPRSKLTREDVVTIRELRKTMMVKDIALLFGVSPSSISEAARGVFWKSITDR